MVAKGRPREFDIDEALDRALEVFWSKGFEGASLAELTRVMGINRPSLYAAFGSKEGLFCKALDRYVEGTADYFEDALAEKSAKKVFERLLLGAADFLTNRSTPKGCLIVRGAMTCTDASKVLQEAMAARRAAREKAIRQRFEVARTKGDLPAGADPKDLARFILTMINGMAVRASAGTSRKDLRRVAQMAIRAWPR